MDFELAETSALAPRQQRRRVVCLIALGATLVLAASLMLWLNPVAAPTWHRVTLRSIAAPSMGIGEFVATEQRALTARDHATVEQILRQPGESVAAGDVVLMLESPALRNELESARLRLQRTRLELDAQQAEVQQLVADAAIAERNAQIALNVAEADLRAHKELAVRQVVSQLRLAQVEADYRRQENSWHAAQQRHVHLQARLSSKQRSAADLLQLEQVQVELLRERVAALSLRAPIAGVIKRVEVKLGDSVPAGTRLAMLGPERPDAVRLRFPQRDLATLTLGSKLTLMSNGEPFTAQISRIEPDLRDGYVVVEARAQALPATARVDMAVRAERIASDARPMAAVAAPDQALLAGSALSITRRRDGKTTALELRDVQRLGEWLVFPSQIQEGDEIAFRIDRN